METPSTHIKQGSSLSKYRDLFFQLIYQFKKLSLKSYCVTITHFILKFVRKHKRFRTSALPDLSHFCTVIQSSVLENKDEFVNETKQRPKKRHMQTDQSLIRGKGSSVERGCCGVGGNLYREVIFTAWNSACIREPTHSSEP